MARLIIFDDHVRGIELPNRQVMIGRSKKNDIPINDSILSRKHCSIVPVGDQYRLLDLKSSNGTYLNGRKVDKMELTIDDIVEIGRTVMVFLEEGIWSRGDGLARLRNPLKAQELVARIKLHNRSKKDGAEIPLMKVEQKAEKRRRRPRRTQGKTGPRGPAVDPWSFSDFDQALEDFLVHRAAFQMARRSPELRRLVSEVLKETLNSSVEGEPASGIEQLRARIRAGMKERLEQIKREGRKDGDRPPPVPKVDGGEH